MLQRVANGKIFKALPASTSTRDQTTSESSTYKKIILAFRSFHLVGKGKDTQAKVDEDTRFTDK